MGLHLTSMTEWLTQYWPVSRLLTSMTEWLTQYWPVSVQPVSRLLLLLPTHRRMLLCALLVAGCITGVHVSTTQTHQHTHNSTKHNTWHAYRRPRDTCMTNGLRHGMQFGMPMTEEIVAVCMGMCVVRARPWREFQNVYHGMHWHALSLNSCA